MAKKSKKLVDPGNSADFKVNPFANLKSLITVENTQEKVVEKQQEMTSEESDIAKLSKADQELLKSFADGANIEISGRGEVIRKLPKVNVRRERKGRGGKTVLVVKGLEDLTMEEQMELCKDVKKGLGTGARFEDNDLVVQGEQEDRLRDWLLKQGYKL